jgi:hypothetical protein
MSSGKTKRKNFSLIADLASNTASPRPFGEF